MPAALLLWAAVLRAVSVPVGLALSGWDPRAGFERQKCVATITSHPLGQSLGGPLSLTAAAGSSASMGDDAERAHRRLLLVQLQLRTTGIVATFTGSRPAQFSRRLSPGLLLVLMAKQTAEIPLVACSLPPATPA